MNSPRKDRTLIELVSDVVSLSFDPAIGQIVAFTVNENARKISPLHQAPWVGRGETFPEGMAPHLKTLGGDFFCAPFGKETDGVPLHGWPANSHWTVKRLSNCYLSAKLDRTVNGATLLKEIELRSGHPFVYQRHTFFDGAGPIEVSNHANVAVPNGGLIRTSLKQIWATPAKPLESDPKLGRSGLSYPATSPDPRAFPARVGTVDLTSYPWLDKHEDFVVGLEAADSQLGWTAVTRPKQGDVFLSLRRATVLPMTMLWHSNGGRDYPPWSGRHFGCLGVEEGVAGSLISHVSPNIPITPSALALSKGQATTICHAIGAVDWPSGEAIQAVTCGSGQICIAGEGVARRSVPFHENWVN